MDERVVDDELTRALEVGWGIKELFPVQRSVIPLVLSCRDVLVRSATGSGKTFCYVVPVAQLLRSRLVPRVRCLVVAPSRDTADQACDVFRRMFQLVTSAAPPLRAGVVAEAAVMPRHPDALRDLAACDVLVVTVDGILDLLGASPEILEGVSTLVLDEADVLLESGEWVDAVMGALSNTKMGSLSDCGGPPRFRTCRYPFPQAEWRDRLVSSTVFPAGVFTDERPGPMSTASSPRVQKLLFSATLKESARKLVKLRLQNVARCDDSAVEENEAMQRAYKLPPTLKQFYYDTQMAERIHLLACLVRKSVKASEKVIVFAPTVQVAHFIFETLKSWLPVGLPDPAGQSSSTAARFLLHYSPLVSREQRVAALQQMKTSGGPLILVTTDALRRGIDLPDVSTVISYENPPHINGYIHRAGRTARAGKPGVYITLVGVRTVRYQLAHFAKKAHSTVERDVIPMLEIKETWDSVAATAAAASKLTGVTLKNEVKEWRGKRKREETADAGDQRADEATKASETAAPVARGARFGYDQVGAAVQGFRGGARGRASGRGRGFGGAAFVRGGSSGRGRGTPVAHAE